MKTFSLALCVTLAAGFTVAKGGSTIDPENQYAHGANIGWIDARGDGDNGAVIGWGYCWGYLYAANLGWISLGSGTPANGHSYQFGSAGDSGVNHDGEGRLSGYAWGANIGWITLSQNEGEGEPRVDLRTGVLSGYAWGANVGWISLSNMHAHVRTQTLDPGPDTDDDGLPDAWERSWARHLDVLNVGDADYDGDGISDTDEFLADTHPGDSNHWFRITSLLAQAGTNRVAWRSSPKRLYRVQAADALLSPATNWASVGDGLLGPPTGDSMQTEIATDGPVTTRFYRVQAVLPLTP